MEKEASGTEILPRVYRHQRTVFGLGHSLVCLDWLALFKTCCTECTWPSHPLSGLAMHIFITLDGVPTAGPVGLET